MCLRVAKRKHNRTDGDVGECSSNIVIYLYVFSSPEGKFHANCIKVKRPFILRTISSFFYTFFPFETMQVHASRRTKQTFESTSKIFAEFHIAFLWLKLTLFFFIFIENLHLSI